MVVVYFEAPPYHLPEGLRTPTRYVTGGSQIPVEKQGETPPPPVEALPLVFSVIHFEFKILGHILCNDLQLLESPVRI